MVALVSHYIMPQSHCTVGPSRRLRRTPDAAPGWTCVTRDWTWPTARWSGITVGILVAPRRSKKSFEMFKTFVARPGSLLVFLLRDSTGKSPGRYRDHREGTETTRKSVFYYGTKPVDPGGPVCWLRPGSPRFARVHHGSLGLGTVDQGVALRKHPGRPRLAPVVRGWARQRPEASRWLAGGTPVVMVGIGWWRKYGWSRTWTVITEFLERGYIKSETARAFRYATLTLTVNIYQILFRRTLQPRNTSWMFSRNVQRLHLYNGSSGNPNHCANKELTGCRKQPTSQSAHAAKG